MGAGDTEVPAPIGAGAGGRGTGAASGSRSALTEATKDGSRTAIWPWRERSTDFVRIRAASCGAWKPVEFSAYTKSSRKVACRCSDRA